jgi:hypothetical protein
LLYQISRLGHPGKHFLRFSGKTRPFGTFLWQDSYLLIFTAFGTRCVTSLLGL